MRYQGKVIFVIIVGLAVFGYLKFRHLDNAGQNNKGSGPVSLADESAAATADPEKTAPQDVEELAIQSAEAAAANQEQEAAAEGLGTERSGVKVVVKDEPQSISVEDPKIKIKITRKPEGEEPDWVQQAWVGLEIPVLRGSYEQKGGQEVLSKQFRAKDNYIVPLEVALSLLKEKNPKAEKWWRDNVDLIGVFGIGFDRDVAQLIIEDESE